MTTALPTGLVDADPVTEALAVAAPLPAPMPTFSGDQMRQAFTAYKQLQQTLDDSMPDQIIRIEDRLFRKKGYWRAISVAFNLTVEPVEERREVQGTFEDGQPNFGYSVVYRARTTTGRSASGDGCCFAIEKAPRQQPNRWQALPKQASEHNVRSHAHTRAFNRAVSNLVGFGEVSAEEIDRDDEPRTISQPQVKRLFAIAKSAGWKTDALRDYLRTHYGVRASSEILVSHYDQVCAELQAGPAAPPKPDADQPF